MSNNLLLIIVNDLNTLHVSLNYYKEMKFVISSDNILEIKKFYIVNNINVNNLLTTFETTVDKFGNPINTNKFDSVFNSMIFFSKIINKIFFDTKVKLDITLCISKQYIKRVFILSSHIFKNVNNINFVYADDNSDINVLSNIEEQKHLDMFYKSHYYNNKF